MIDAEGNIIDDTKPDSAKDKIKQGLKQLHNDHAKREYIPHQAGENKTKIRDGLEELFPSGKDGKALPKPLTVEERRAAIALGLNPDEIEDKRVVDD